MRLFLFAPLLFALVLPALVGCSSKECVIDTDCPLASYCVVATNTCAVIGGDAGAHDGGAVDGAPRDGSSDGAPADAHVDAGAPDMGDGHTRSGFVVATTAADGSRTDVAVSFGDLAHSVCTTHTDGPCTVTECPTGGAAPTASASGTISIQNGTHVLSLMPGTGMAYTPMAATPALWSGGDMVDIASSGGVVPTFHVMLAGPGTATLTAPSVPMMSTFSIVRSTDLALAWTPGTPMAAGAKVFAALSWSDGMMGGASSTILCGFDAAGGSGTVPATAMAVFPMGMTGSYAFLVSTSTMTPAGGYDVTVTLSTMATMPDPSGPATGAVTFM